MVPKVKLEIDLLNTQGRPIRKRHISYAIEALDDSRSADRDPRGAYVIDDVPVGYVGRVSVASTTNLPSIRSASRMKFTEGGTYRITAQTEAWDTAARQFKLVIRAATDAQGNDVLDQILVDEEAG
jgi:hypothetical protein